MWFLFGVHHLRPRSMQRSSSTARCREERQRPSDSTRYVIKVPSNFDT